MLYSIYISIELLDMIYNKYNINKINAKNEIIRKAYNIYNI